MLMLCPICSEDFQQQEALCPDCGCGLVPASLDTTVDTRVTPDNSIELVELCRPRLYSLAMLIKQILEQNGVAAFVPGANAFSVMPHLAFSGEMRIMVSSDQFDYARQLYSAYFEGDSNTLYDSQCGSNADQSGCNDDARYDWDCDAEEL
jgi:hypothetical protein